LATTIVLLAEAHRFAQASPAEVQQVATTTSEVAASEKPQAQVDSSPVKGDNIKPEPEEKKDEPAQEKTEEKKDEPVQGKPEVLAAKTEPEAKKEDTPEKTDLPVEEKKVVPETTEEKKDEPVQEKSEEKKEVPATVSDSSTEAKDPAVELKSTEFKPKPASAKGRKPKAVAPEENNSLPKGEGQEFKVLVVGFTHSSIDNLINKILDMVSEFDKVKKDKAVDFKLPVARLVKRDADTSDMPESANFELLKAENAATVLRWLNNNVQCVLGGTIWAVRKVFKERFNQPPRFHMVIVDEASQMLLSDAYHPLRYLLKDEGRLILAGDDQQLPPIINGEYPELPPSEPVLFSSIFNAFRHKDVNQECTSMLIENWRMNQSLVELPSNTIYKTSDPKMKYHAANDKIATQSFPLKKLKDDQFYYINKGVETTETVSHPLLKLFLDGDSPLVVVLLKVDTYSEIGNFPHSDLIAAFTSAVRKTFNKAEGTTEDNLWREKLHIVAPHHIQRQAIFNSIYGSKKWNQDWHKEAEPFIETVEKTQGREVDCTIVDYGLLNTSQIKNELRFIYSRPRLNVSLTRAKKKCLVVVSDILLSAAIEHIFDSKETERGFTHFQNLIDYARTKNSLYNLALSELPSTIAELEKDPFFKN
jgi:chemotaxis protein histidine kinase CheA